MRISKFNFKLLVFSILNVFLLFRINVVYSNLYLALFSVIGLVYIVFHFKLFSDKKITPTVLFILSSMGIAVISMLINGTNDISYLKMLVSLVYKIGLGSFSFMLFKRMLHKRATLKNYFTSFILSCLFILFTSLVFIAFSSISDLWIGKFVPKNELLDEGYFYRKSIIGYTGFDEVSIFSISLLFCAYEISDRLNHKKSIKLYLFIYLVLIMGCLLYGRVSIVTLILSLILLFVLARNKLKVMITFLYLFLFLFCAFLVFYLVSKVNIMFKYWFDWAFEPLLAFFSGKKVSSMNSLERMYVMPSLKTFFIGDGRYNIPGGYYMNIDVGFLRAIYYFGIFGLLSNYMIIISFAVIIAKKLKAKRYQYLFLFLIINMLLYELKGVMWDGCILYMTTMYCAIKENKEYKAYAYQCYHSSLQCGTVLR